MTKKKIIKYDGPDYGQFTIGRVVQLSTAKDTYLGHIMNFELTEYDSCSAICVRVRWCDGSEFCVHPINLIVL
jgi:hypothetical protein